MKRVIFYYPLTEGEVLIGSPYIGYENAQEKQDTLIRVLHNFGVEIYFARGELSHKVKNTFIPQFRKVGDTWEENKDSITADLVLGFGIPAGVEAEFNTMGEFTKDKRVFEHMFPQYAIPSIICHNYSDIEENFGNISTDKKVLKPSFGTRSRGIIIQENIPKKEEIEEIYFPYLLQEFFNTSGGFFGEVGMHDFRCIILNGEIIAAYLRQPETGKYTANSFRKGGFIDYTHKEIPKEILDICSDVDTKFQDITHRYYSIDFGISQNSDIKIFELNSAPGLTNSELSEKLGIYIAKNVLKVL